MTHLLSDARVVEAVARAMAEVYGEGYEEWHLEHAPAVAAAAVAALPREELIETFARAVAEGRDYWNDLDEHTRDEYREDVRVGFKAIGLIPEHITATEEPKP